jgi:hypothetical protein
MAFRGKHPVRINIIVKDETLEQVSRFRFLGYDLSFDYDDDVKNKLHRFQDMR